MSEVTTESTMTNNIFFVLSKDNPVFKCYAYYACMLIIKVGVMSLITAAQRFRKKAFASPEDSRFMPGGVAKYDDPDVERVRRAHHNDLENVIPFLVMGLIYCLAHPNVTAAKWLYRVGAVSRIVHTIFYVFVPVTPVRTLAFMTTFWIMIYMAIASLVYFF